MSKYIWEKRPLYNENITSSNPLLHAVLSHRAINTDNFLTPVKHDIHRLFDDWEKAARLILQYIENKDKIIIYGDYDADGVSATAFLNRAIGKLGGNVGYYIPHRTKEGYGINKNAIDEIYESVNAGNVESESPGSRPFESEDTHPRLLLITVDTGISNYAEVEYAKSLGIDIIVTDHHEIPENKPKADAIMNPKSLENIDLHNLAGAGMAWVLMQGVLSVVETNSRLSLPMDYFDEFIELPAIGTVGDISELSGYNRALVKHGLANLRNTKIIGLSSLLKLMDIKPELVNTETIGFRIAPAINAAGRLDSASDAIELLLTDNEENAFALAQKVIESNAQRQAITAKSSKEAIDIYHQFDWEAQPIAVLYNPDWHAGIIGLVASHVVKAKRKPAIVIGGLDDNGVAKGSCRSIEGFNIFDIIFANHHHLSHFGGHSLAAGFSITTDNIDNFIDGCIESATNFWADTQIPNTIHYDEDISLPELTMADVKGLHDTLEPYGRGNPKPIFRAMTNLLSQKKIGKNNEHLRLEFKLNNDDNRKITAIAFGMGHLFPLPNQPLDVLYTPSINVWNGNESLQVEVLDIRAAL
jgi:single-stranded-DNA-specific exonuclease